MPETRFNYDFVANQVHKKNFGILGTTDSQNKIHSTGILYGTSPPGKKLILYLLTGKNYRKTRNIAVNRKVSFVIPFPHYYLRFVPPSCISMQGEAEIIEINDPEARSAFRKGRVLRMVLGSLDEEIAEGGNIFIRLIPKGKVHCYGVGLNVVQIQRSIESASYSVVIPD